MMPRHHPDVGDDEKRSTAKLVTWPERDAKYMRGKLAELSDEDLLRAVVVIPHRRTVICCIDDHARTVGALWLALHALAEDSGEDPRFIP